MLFQSSAIEMPLRCVGTAAIRNARVCASCADAISIRIERPEQKLFWPLNCHAPRERLTVRASSGFSALPQNHCWRAVRSNHDSHCAGAPNSRTVASIKWWKPNTCASELSAAASTRTTSSVVRQLAPRPP